MNKNIKIIVKTNPDEIKSVIEFCDYAFKEPILKRNGIDDTIYKLFNFSIFVVAYVENEIAGYAAFYANDKESKIAYLSLIATRPEFQRRGIGDKLLYTCEEKALKNGMEKMKLEVKKYNINAIEFYERHGYSYLCECNDNSFYMIKNLSKVK